MHKLIVSLIAIPALLALAGAGFAAQAPGDAARRIGAVKLALSRPDDEPVVRGAMRARSGEPYRPREVAGDLFRLPMLGYQIAQVDVAFDAKMVDLTVAAARVEKPKDGHLAAARIEGGIPAVDAAARPFLQQQASTLFRKRPVDYLDVLLDAATLEERYHAAGHLDARVTRLALSRTGRGDQPGDDAVALTFHIQPGRRYKLGEVRVATSDDAAVPAKQILAALDAAPGDPWSGPLRGDLAATARRFLYEHGYLDANAEAEPAPQDDGTVDVALRVEPGDRCTLNRIVLRGAGDHAKAVRELAGKPAGLEPGKPVDPAAVDALRRAIEDLAVFTRVELRFVPLRDQPRGRRDLVVRLEPLDLGRETGEAEQLYYRMAKQVIRLHNAGRDGVRSLRLDGALTAGGRHVALSGTLRRPDLIDLEATISAAPTRPNAVACRARFVRLGDRSALSLRGPKGVPDWTIRLPRPVAVGLRFAVLPPGGGPDDARSPTQLALGAAVTKQRDSSGVLVLGRRCPPVAAYSTRHANAFATRPPKLETPNVLVLPPLDKGSGPTRVEADARGLPHRITRRDANGDATTDLRLRINTDIGGAAARDAKAALAGPNSADEDALVVPVLIALSLPEQATAHAAEALKRHPDSAACLAAKGLVDLTQNADPAGLDLLRKAAAQDEHPAYRILLAETLLRLKQFDAAARICAAAAPAKSPPLAAADILLASSLSTRAILDLVGSDARDYRRRLAVDAILACVGAARYADGADAARTLLRTAPNDPQVLELLARCELGRGKPKAALDAIAAVDPKRATPPMHVYAALAHLRLDSMDAAAAALDRAMADSPELRNLLYLQRHATELDGHFGQAKPKAALAEAFSRATRAPLDDEQQKQRVAIVNDAYVLRPQVDALAAKLLDAAAAKDEESARRLAVERIIEDILIVRWAMWSGITLDTDALGRTLEADMERLGTENVADYRKRLKDMGTSLEERRRRVAEGALKRQAFTRIIADRVRVDPAEVRTYYKEHPKQFRIPRRARFRMISLHHVRFPNKDRAAKLARALLAELKAKRATVAALSKQYSHDPNAERGGLWENVMEGSLLQPLDKAVFALQPGELSGPIETDRGTHIVKMEAMEPARDIPLAEAAPHVVRAMQERQSRRALAKWIDEWRAESYVKVIAEAGE
jgi:peptidyl-prolyl cis-trans isomerase C